MPLPVIDLQEAIRAMPIGTQWVNKTELAAYESDGRYVIWEKATEEKYYGMYSDDRHDRREEIPGEIVRNGLVFRIAEITGSSPYTIIRYGMEGERLAHTT